MIDEQTEKTLVELVGACRLSGSAVTLDAVQARVELETGAVGSGDEQNADRLIVHIRLDLPVASFREQLQTSVEERLLEMLNDPHVSENLQVRVVQEIRTHRTQGGKPALDQVRNIIAVASGKGGVGKSTTCVNLALALAREGASVGVLDADIFGPSLPTMLGVEQGTRPETREGRFFVPVERFGLQTMSMGYLVTEQTPVVWRGPKASGALQQMMQQTLWNDLDYLLVDLPPGTGDIQLTLAQQIPVAGSIVVTTPQDVALLDAIKGIEMFRKVDIPVLGIVENMSMHICSKCGHAEPVFGQHGGERIAEQYQTALLGQLPLALEIRQQADEGVPVVAASPDSDHAQAYIATAQALAQKLAGQQLAEKVAFPRVHTHH